MPEETSASTAPPGSSEPESEPESERMSPFEDVSLDADLARGLVHIHEKLGLRILAEQQLTRHLVALTELLVDAGVVSHDALEERKKALDPRMSEKARTRWSAAQVYEDVRDKYAVESPPIDCSSRLHACKAACCRLSFHLSRQDLEENRVRWDLGRPFHIARRPDGYCTHADPRDGHCRVHAHRPVVCREYDCRKDDRIWKDFEARVPSDAVAAFPPLGAHVTDDAEGR